jgi:hypothetical protein
MTDHRPIGSCCGRPLFTAADGPAGPDLIDLAVRWIGHKVRKLALRIRGRAA